MNANDATGALPTTYVAAVTSSVTWTAKQESVRACFRLTVEEFAAFVMLASMPTPVASKTARLNAGIPEWSTSETLATTARALLNSSYGLPEYSACESAEYHRASLAHDCDNAIADIAVYGF